VRWQADLCDMVEFKGSIALRVEISAVGQAVVFAYQDLWHSMRQSSFPKHWAERRSHWLASTGQGCSRQLLLVVILECGLQLRDERRIAMRGEGLNIIDDILKLAGRSTSDEFRRYVDSGSHSKWGAIVVVYGSGGILPIDIGGLSNPK
jgi:hypothetical protein